MIQAAALRNLSNISEELRREYNGMNWFQKQWYGSAESFTQQGLRDAKDDSLKPIEDAIQNYLDAADIAADTWLTSTAHEAINTHIGIVGNSYAVKEEMDDVISDMLQEILGVADYASGFATGLSPATPPAASPKTACSMPIRRSSSGVSATAAQL